MGRISTSSMNIVSKLKDFVVMQEMFIPLQLRLEHFLAKIWMPTLLSTYRCQFFMI